MRPIPKRLALALGLVWTGWACAQQAVPVAPALLAEAGALAEAHMRSLPSFECERNGFSETVRRRDAKLEQHAEFTGTVRARVEASPDGTRVVREQTTLSTVNGKPAGHHHLPYELHGAFLNALSYIAPDEQSCYTYTLAPSPLTEPGELRIEFRAARPFVPACANLPGLVGHLVLNAGHRVTHVDRSIPLALADETDLVPVASVDFAPVDLNGQPRWLPLRMDGESPDGEDLRRIHANFTHCHLFHTGVRLLPGTTTVAPDPAPQP